MPRRHSRSIGSIPLAVFLALLPCTMPPSAAAFTQSGVSNAFGSTIPMGHEWVTRMAALELLGGDKTISPDPNDPRKKWGSQGKAKNTDISSPGAQDIVRRIKSVPIDDSRYASTYKAVYDAIIGERWVDIGGFNVAKAYTDDYDCFDGVTQLPDKVQYDHFMRQSDDSSGTGGIHAIERSSERFVSYFIDAAMAQPMNMRVWDGGTYSAQVDVERTYFLFGRAVHLFEDSFSSEHTVRIKDDMYERVRQIKAYQCARGSEQHTHSTAAALDYTSGDVIWKPESIDSSGWSSYKASNMKTVALVATEGSKDLWAAFIRTLGTPLAEREAKAKEEAKTLIKNWMNAKDEDVLNWYDDQSHRDNTFVLSDDGSSGKGQTQKQCVQALGFPSGDQHDVMQKIKRDQRVCLFNVASEEGYDDLYDNSIRMPFNWKWKDDDWLIPPDGWDQAERDAFTGQIARIKSVANGNYMMITDALPKTNSWVYCKAQPTPVDFVIEYGNRGHFRLRWYPGLFLSYTGTTGAVKLYNSPSEAEFHLQPAGAGQAIKNTYWNQYIWLSSTSPYLTNAGNPANVDAQWTIVPQP